MLGGTLMRARPPVLPACLQGQTFQSSLGKTLQDEVYNLFPPNSIGEWVGVPGLTPRRGGGDAPRLCLPAWPARPPARL